MKNFLVILPFIDPGERNLVVLDEHMGEGRNLDETSKLFTQWSHHRNITVVYIFQNVFDKWKLHMTISLNSQYIVLLKNPRDQRQRCSLGQQVFTTQVT